VTHNLNELYLQWLYDWVADSNESSRSQTYWKLLKQLYTTEFVWFVPNDDNRCADGVDLRYEFCESQDLTDVDPHWMSDGCSMLELMLGLSRRLAFMAEGEPSDWFWVLVDNIQIRFNDKIRYPRTYISDVLDTVMWRTYNKDGLGGLFPLQHADRDQRNVELWDQLNAYVLEHS
jgi:hypothetical protein